jgi:hypothetical protein
MKETVEPGWDDLQALWRQPAPPPRAVQARMRAAVRRHSLLMRLATLADVIALAGMVALAAWVWRARPDLYTAAWIAIVIPLAVATLAFNLWNRRGAWRAVSQSTRAFVDLSIRRARARARLAHVLRPFVAFELLAAVGLLAFARATDRAPLGRLVLAGATVAALAAAVVAWAGWYGRRARRELAELDDLRGQLEENEPGP